jgi:hypothetical protein
MSDSQYGLLMSTLEVQQVNLQILKFVKYMFNMLFYLANS